MYQPTDERVTAQKSITADVGICIAGHLLHLCRERGGKLVTHLLVEGLDGLLWSDEDDPRAQKAGRFFAELVLLPFLLRGLSMQDLSGLRAEIETHSREHAAFRCLAGFQQKARA